MSFNIRYGTAPDGENAWPRRRAALVAAIEAFHPDLLATQETLAAQRDELRARLARFDVVGVGRDDGRLGGEMAALFFDRARFEQVAAGQFWLSPTPDAVGSRGWDAALPRIATWVRLRERAAPARTLCVLDTHFDHQGALARRESARLLRDRIKAVCGGDPVILAGDFNSAAAPGDADSPYAVLTAALTDSFPEAPQRTPAEACGTYHAFTGRPEPARIDWILHGPEFVAREVGIDVTKRDGRYPSDHFPVTAVLVRRAR